jgi:arylsulfatase A-like enzyme
MPIFPSLLGAMLLAFVQAAALCAQPGGMPPNVLFVMLDDQNDYVGFLGGHPQARTPWLDLLADQGHVFVQTHCNGPLCAPSRTSLLTGKHPDYNQVYANAGEYSDVRAFRDLFQASLGNETVYTLPELFRQNGYYTANFYKIFHGWSDYGFDNDYDAEEPDPCSRDLSWNRFMDLNGNADLKPAALFGERQEGVKTLSFGRLDDAREEDTNDHIMVDSALAFLDRYADEGSPCGPRPFFAAVGLYRPHIPWHTAARYFDGYYNPDYDASPYRLPFNEPNARWPPIGILQAGEPPVPDLGFAELGPAARRIVDGKSFSWDAIRTTADSLASVLVGFPGTDSAARAETLFRSIRANATMAYLAAMAFSDEQFGRLWQGLNRHPELAANTIVVVCSDHGYSLGERRHFHKAALWETDLRVPLVILDPRNPGAGRRIASSVSLLDLMPTLLELAGIAEPTMPDGTRYPDGYSLVPLLEDPNLDLRRPVHAGIRFATKPSDPASGVQHSVRDDRFHYIRYVDAEGVPDIVLEEELYEIGRNRQVDPDEWYNLANDSAFASMKAYLSQWLPDSALFQRAMPSLRIAFTDSACTLLATDTVRARVRWRDAWGQDSPPDTVSYGFRWTLYPGARQMDGPVCAFPLAGWDTASDRVSLSVVAWPLADSNHALADVAQRAFGQTFDAAFAAYPEGRSVFPQAYALPPDPGPARWDYGDGLLIENLHPAVHAYSAPGSYRLTRIQHYGPGGQCVDSGYVDIHLPDSLFDGTDCPEPGSLWVTASSPHQVSLRCAPSAGAVTYRLEYRDRTGGGFTPWSALEVDTPTFLVKGLVPGNPMEARVTAQCSAASSRAGWPIRFRLPSCPPPSDMTLSVDSLRLSMAWTPASVSQAVAQGFRLSIDGMRTYTRVFSMDVAEFGPVSLDAPGGNYALVGVTRCAEVDGTVRNGPISDTVTVVPAWDPRKAGPLDFRVFPNPVRDRFVVQWPDPGHWVLMDAWGRIIRWGRATGDSDVISGVNLLPGGYWLCWQGEGAIRSTSIQVVGP